MQVVSACVFALLGVQVGGRGQPMHAEISGDDPACMPNWSLIESQFCRVVWPATTICGYLSSVTRSC
jgi:hypothetical protein